MVIAIARGFPSLLPLLQLQAASHLHKIFVWPFILRQNGMRQMLTIAADDGREVNLVNIVQNTSHRNPYFWLEALDSSSLLLFGGLL